jgi:hypothetical protein
MKRTRRHEGLRTEGKCLATKGGSTLGWDHLDDTHLLISPLPVLASFSLHRSLHHSLFVAPSSPFSSIRSHQRKEKWSEPKQSSKSSTSNHFPKPRSRKTRRAQEEERNGVEKIEELYSFTSRSTERGIGLLLLCQYQGKQLSRYLLF